MRRWLQMLSVLFLCLSVGLVAIPPARAGTVWTLPETLTSGQSSVSSVCVSVADDGTALAAWPQADGVGWSRWNGTGWSPPEVLASAGAVSPSIALAADASSAVLAWEAGRQMHAARWDGATWGAPQILSGASTTFLTPSATISADGSTAMVVWQMQDGVGNWSVQARRWSAGWAAVDTVITTGSVQPRPSLSMADDGHAVVTMIGPGSSSPLTVGAMRWDGASWSTLSDLMGGVAGVSAVYDPGVGISRDGSTVVALWPVSIGAIDRIQTAAGGTGGWTAAEDLSTPGTRYAYPRVSLTTDGSTAAAVWGPPASGSGIGAVQVATRSQGAWTAPFTLDDSANSLPQVALSEAGDSAVAVWNRSGATVAAAWWTGNSWEPSAVVSDPLTSAGAVRLAMGDDAGEAIAVWRTTSGSVQAARIATVPSAPTGATSIAGDATATVTWVAPSTDGGRPVTGYRATASPGGASCTTGGTSCTVTGLANGTPYTFTVVATNAVGDSKPSEPSAAVTPLAAVEPPTTDKPPAGPVTTTVTGWPRRIRTSKARVVVKVRITPALGRKVLLEKRDGGWRTVRTSSLASSSQARLKVRLRVPGVYRLTVPATSSATAYRTKRLVARSVGVRP